MGQITKTLIVAVAFARLVLAVPPAPPEGKSLSSLDAHNHEFLVTAMQWCDRYWDERAGFIWSLEMESAPVGSRARRHMVRETSWYAVGLLLRDQPGDRERAARALKAVLDQQIDEPGQVWDGTFYRSPEEPHPPAFARMWIDYDPNWRVFIGTTFAIILSEYSPRLPFELVKRMEGSIGRALEGEMKEGRLKTSYTNIALMYGFLLSYAGNRFNKPEWVKMSETWNADVYRRFKKSKTFDEYNSPTYYGVDLYGLALWRIYGSTANVRAMGSEMEAGLWRDVGAFYHPGLKNLAGPYDRSYGMDMRRYVSVVGIWMRTVLDAGDAPFPDLKTVPDHADDLPYAPVLIFLGAKIPSDVMKEFHSFVGEHGVKRDITPTRTATAWLGMNVMLGGEITTLTKEAGTPGNQFHPATVHWKTPGDDVGWIRLIASPRVNAHAAKDRLDISAIGNSTFRISVPGADPRRVERTAWTLPGLNVAVQTDAKDAKVTSTSEYVEIEYYEATRITLTTGSRLGQ